MSQASRQRRKVAVGLALLVTLPGIQLVTATASAAYADDVAFTRLQNELGAGTPTGAGVLVSQVEAAVTVNGQQTWVPTGAQFAGKIFTYGSPFTADVYSGHATGVATVFYGSPGSVADDITNITVYWAMGWLGGDYLNSLGALPPQPQPLASTSRVVNHSWVGDGTTSNREILSRLDWVAENDEIIQVTAMNNGANPSSRGLMAQGFNAIAVGRSDGLHEYGSYAIDSLYTSGRAKPDIVAPAGSTSNATPGISAIAALLVQQGQGNATLSTDPDEASVTVRGDLLIRNAERVEVIRAALMAGADRVTRNTTTTNLGLYRDTAGNRTTNGLDRRYGAGQVNAYNSHFILAAGEQQSPEDGGPATSVAARGFDYDPAFGGGAGRNTAATYSLPVATSPQLLTAALVWNLDVDGGSEGAFNSSAILRNLTLNVLNVASPSAPVVVAASASTVDNTEHAWLVVPANAQYALQVSRAVATNFNHDFGIAWQLLPDADGDGAHDGQDNCIAAINGPIVRDSGGASQRDSNNDGYGNLCDADLNNDGNVNASDLAIFRLAFGSANADADLDGSGTVNAADLAIFRNLFGKVPGPSAYAT